jgi:hypothetical protein
VPSEADVQAFAEIVAWISQTVGSLEFRPASALEAFSVAPGVELDSLDALRAALASVEEEPFAQDLDRNRATVVTEGSLWTVHFPWRTSQPLRLTGPGRCPPGGFRVQVDATSSRVVRTFGHRPETWDLDHLRRQAFLAEHAEIPSPTRDSLREGWLEPGMTREMVLAAWGAPVGELRQVMSYRREGCSVDLRFQDGLLLEVP